jgi:hypothetical protein
VRKGGRGDGGKGRRGDGGTGGRGYGMLTIWKDSASLSSGIPAS